MKFHTVNNYRRLLVCCHHLLLYWFLLSLTHSFNVISCENMLSHLTYNFKITNNNINSDKSKCSIICHPVDINYYKFTLYLVQLGQPANHFGICLYVCVHMSVRGCVCGYSLVLLFILPSKI